MEMGQPPSFCGSDEPASAPVRRASTALRTARGRRNSTELRPARTRSPRSGRLRQGLDDDTPTAGDYRGGAAVSGALVNIETWWDDAEIAAPIDTVWALAVDVIAWPSWHEYTTNVSADGPMGQGKTFVWAIEGLEMTMTVAEVWEHNRIVCGSIDHEGTTGIHEWTFQPLPLGVRVERRAYFWGPAIERDPEGMACLIAFFKDRWLDDLQVQAEPTTAGQ